MRPFTSLARSVLLKLAIVFATATIAYSVIWMYAVRHPFAVGGFIGRYSKAYRAMDVLSVELGSNAENAGLRPGDRIVAINDRPMENLVPYYDAVILGKVGDVVQFTVDRPGMHGRLTLREALQTLRLKTAPQLLVGQILGFYPLLFLVVGLAVLFLRPQDPNAWLLALVFGGFIAGAPLNEAAIRPSLRGFSVFYRTVMVGLLPAIFYYFFAVFPVHSAIDRRLPWLKSALSALAVAVLVPLGSWCLLAGGSSPLYVILPVVDQWHVGWLLTVYFFGLYGLGLVSLVWNSARPASVAARRKTRVIVWGTAAGFLPMLLLSAVLNFLHKAIYDIPFWAWAFVVMSLFLLPLSFAYAVVKHRVLEIPVLLRRSARYLLVQRGFTILLSLLSVGVTMVFALSLARYLEPLTGAAVPGGIALGTGFGTLLLWTGTRVHKRVGERIDRAFFRNAYDARMILEDLVEKTRTATDRHELAVLLEYHLNQALQPRSLAIYLETSDSQLSAARGDVPPELQTISAAQPIMPELERHGRVYRHSGAPCTWEVSAESPSGTTEPFLLAPLRPDCLLPILGRDSRLVGLLVLGARLSEEPYTSDDKHLLTSVASQAGVALESIRLGEKIAERIEAERRLTQEMEYAKQVQAKLFPQKLPSMKTLQYAGGCLQARQVGGDYYDFLELRPGRLALVLADIAGKGISGALLMANLQANLRSQYAVALDDLPRLLKSVNQLFYENTGGSSYATLFFADYDDSSRRLRYVNCGHLPPLLLRAGQNGQDRASEQPAAEWLHSTCTVLGLFEKWQCDVAEVPLAPGDMLVLYTDGVTEAASADGEQFGESRLLDTLRSHPHLPVTPLLQAIVAAVQQFSDGEQQDDITLVVARCRE